MSITTDVKKSLAAAVLVAIETARENGELAIQKLPEVMLEIPREKEHGDYATNVALTMAREARKSPRQIAEIVVKYLETSGSYIASFEVAGPGFINFWLDKRWLADGLQAVEAEGSSYGRVNLGSGERIQVEFVSANPTGPLHVGHGRGAVVGSVLANLLEWAGYEVTREYYINDAGNQIANFAKSLDARYRQALGEEAPFPEEGYHGRDLVELMEKFAAEHGDAYVKKSAGERMAALTKYALAAKLAAIRQDLAAFGVTFDVWFSEQSLHDGGELERTIEDLRGKGHIYEKDGALWLRSTAYGDDKDRVVVRENGMPTYIAADIAYHKNKFERGFDRVINIWGADHHGYIPRMKAAVAALGYDPDALEVLIVQLVTLLRDGEPVVMSKRAGELVTLADVIEEVGKDAARFFFVMRSADSHLDFDLSLAKSQSADNPVYYIQYAHARICSILRQAVEAGSIPEVPPGSELDLSRSLVGVSPGLDRVDLAVLNAEPEIDLMKKIVVFPEEVAQAAERREPHAIARYALELAGLFHPFYNTYRVITEDKALTMARLVLVDTVRLTLRNALAILGIAAPERM